MDEYSIYEFEGTVGELIDMLQTTYSRNAIITVVQQGRHTMCGSGEVVEIITIAEPNEANQ